MAIGRGEDILWYLYVPYDCHYRHGFPAQQNAPFGNLGCVDHEYWIHPAHLFIGLLFLLCY